MSDGFCPNCAVTMDLHPDADDDDYRSCNIAEEKARLLEDFGGLFGV